MNQWSLSFVKSPILGGNERDRNFSGYLIPRNRSFAHEAVMVHRCSQTMAKLVNITPITRTYFIDMGSTVYGTSFFWGETKPTNTNWGHLGENTGPYLLYWC